MLSLIKELIYIKVFLELFMIDMVSLLLFMNLVLVDFRFLLIIF